MCLHGLCLCKDSASILRLSSKDMQQQDTSVKYLQTSGCCGCGDSYIGVLRIRKLRLVKPQPGRAYPGEDR